jgi:hypothetical protein
MQDLPPFFKEYMEQKFSELHTKIDSVFQTHDNEIIGIKNEIHDTKQDIKWLNQKVWMAMGALCVISIAGGIFASYFKTLNKQQIEEAIKPLEQKSESAQNTAEFTNKTLQNIIKSYNIRVE